MAKHISNMDELAKALQPTLINMVDQLANRVYETLNYFLQDYYSGYEPSSYQRSKDFLYSAVKVDAHPYNGGVRASVYPDMGNVLHVSGVRGGAGGGMDGSIVGTDVSGQETVQLVNAPQP